MTRDVVLLAADMSAEMAPRCDGPIGLEPPGHGTLRRRTAAI
jgi:hypothetical protein